jgi:hypothetical protein
MWGGSRHAGAGTRAGEGRGFCYPGPRRGVATHGRRCSSRVPDKVMTRHWDPLRDLVTLQDRMNRLFQDAAEKRERGEGEGEQELERADWFPPADIYETEKDFTIAVDLPGIERTAPRARPSAARSGRTAASSGGSACRRAWIRKESAPSTRTACCASACPSARSRRRAAWK